MTKSAQVRVAILDLQSQVQSVIQAEDYDAGIAVIHQAIDEDDRDWFHLICHKDEVATWAIASGGQEICQGMNGLRKFVFDGPPIALAATNCVLVDLRDTKITYP